MNTFSTHHAIPLFYSIDIALAFLRCQAHGQDDDDDDPMDRLLGLQPAIERHGRPGCPGLASDPLATLWNEAVATTFGDQVPQPGRVSTVHMQCAIGCGLSVCVCVSVRCHRAPLCVPGVRIRAADLGARTIQQWTLLATLRAAFRPYACVDTARRARIADPAESNRARWLLRWPQLSRHAS